MLRCWGWAASHRPTYHCVHAVCAALQVHAFNTLRVVFNDSNMAMDSSGFHAAGVVAAINSMTAPAWEVSLTWLQSVVAAAAFSCKQQQAAASNCVCLFERGGTAQAAIALQACRCFSRERS